MVCEIAMDEQQQAEWSDELTGILDDIAANSLVLAEAHRRKYIRYKSYAHCFEIPVIIMSVISSTIAAGLTEYWSANTITICTCVLGMAVTVITSIKLYLQIDRILSTESRMYKAFYCLGIDIVKNMRLRAPDRSQSAREYLSETFQEYIKLVDESFIFEHGYYTDKFCEFDDISISNDSPNTTELFRRG